MSTIINNNISALKANRYLSSSNSKVSAAVEKLSSGYRINSGKDDPSGLIISEQLRSQIAGLQRAVSNSSEASNVISIAEGALNEMNEILKKLRSLAIHAANDGVTSPEQVEADQAEMDSGIQTLNRIANTTQYSDQNLLNGSKQLVYDVTTVVNDTADHALLDTAATRVAQIYKRDGVTMSIGFNGYKSAYQANSDTSAQCAYIEADNAYSKCQIDGNSITAAQKFILTGTAGSKQFTYSAGTALGTIVSDINNSKDSTGIGATLIFASDVRIDNTANGSTADPDYTTGTAATGIDYTAGYTYENGNVQIYGANLNDPDEAKVESLTVTSSAAAAFTVGYNCDGDGKIYAKVIDAATGAIEYYKDKDCTMLIGTGDSTYFASTNGSGIPGTPTANLDGIFLQLSDKAENLDVYEIAVVGQDMDNQKDFTTDIGGWADVGNSVMSGVNLGVNTSSDGSIFYKYTPVSFDATSGDVTEYKVEAFTHSSMDPQYLVASSGTVAASATLPQSITVESVEMSNGQQSGLNLTLTIPSSSYTEFPKIEQTASMQFDNVGIRLYATEYGSEEYIRIQNQEGELFYYYREADTLEKSMITADTTVMRYGQDAQITMNGTTILTNGLTAATTTADFSGKLVFNSGSLGLTTIAVTGYSTGSLYSRAQALQAIEENEAEISKNDHYFVPECSTISGTGLVSTTNQAIDLYVDYTVLDQSILDLIQANETLTTTAAYNADGTMTIAISGDQGFSQTTTFNVSPDKLKEGYSLTSSELKGLYIKSSDVVNIDNSDAAGGGAGTAETVALPGDKLTEVVTYATNPRTGTQEDLTNFLGGMQFQLGNTSGDQSRTVYSIQSMDMANLGRVEYEGSVYTLQDVLGGGLASLSRDPILAMSILEQAVDDVTGLRARLGAFQANMLQTNINSLEVAIENLTLTESAIRDTDMATETTEFTKYQIMSQAGTSMLAQANQMSQNVLALLQ